LQCLRYDLHWVVDDLQCPLEGLRIIYLAPIYLQPVENLEQAKKEAVQAARNTLRKDKRINLRLSQKDYHQIQIRAIEEGIPYQTLIAGIVHKYLNGLLIPGYHEEDIKERAKHAGVKTS